MLFRLVVLYLCGVSTAIGVLYIAQPATTKDVAAVFYSGLQQNINRVEHYFDAAVAYSSGVYVDVYTQLIGDKTEDFEIVDAETQQVQQIEHTSRVQLQSNRLSEEQVIYLQSLLKNSEKKRLSEYGDVYDETFTVAFFGDMMLDRHVRKWTRASALENTFDYPFVRMNDVLDEFVEVGGSRGIETIVVNAECPFTDNKSKTEGISNAPLIFTCTPEYLESIKNANISVLSQANNHTQDFGTKGYNESLQNIKKAGLQAFGSPEHGETNPVAYLEHPNTEQKIALVGFNQFSRITSIQHGIDVTTALITKEKNKGNFVIVMPHWGEEYQITPTNFQKNTAEKFALAGADLIIGSHPHVIGTADVISVKRNGEKYLVPVYYSLGNFIFDQYFQPEVKEGQVLAVSFDVDQDNNIIVTSILQNNFDIRRGQIIPKIK